DLLRRTCSSATPRLPPHLLDGSATAPTDGSLQRTCCSRVTSHQRWYVLWMESAKKAETRGARVRKALGMLEAGKKEGLVVRRGRGPDGVPLPHLPSRNTAAENP